MNKSLATFGLLAVAGALSLCDLCGPGAQSAAAPGGLVSVAYAMPVPGPSLQAPAQARAQAPAQVAAPKTVTLAVKGMTCGGCVLSTRKVLTRLPGVAKADVSYEKGTAVVTYDPRKVTVEQMVAAIKTLGYTATPAAG
ncbi:heavy-metal-associated domain-containing protein [Roseisolibacter agri]|nr:heavy-metal-associated domain-containing protein [Roseisolibacter agri]